MLRARFLRRLDNRAFFHFGNPGRNADDHARLKEQPLADNLAQEIAQHSLRVVEIGDNALTQRTYGDDIARRSSQHDARFFTDREHTARLAIHRHYRGLAKHNAFAANVHEHGGRAEIYSNVIVVCAK